MNTDLSAAALLSYNNVIELVGDISKEIDNFKSMPGEKYISINHDYYNTLKSHCERIAAMEQIARKEVDLLNTSLTYLEYKVSLGASETVIERKKKISQMRNSSEKYWQILHENKRRYRKLLQQAKKIIESEETENVKNE